MNTACGDPIRHDPHSHGNLSWCEGDPMTDDFLADLQANTPRKNDCTACALVANMQPGTLRDALRDALGGTIGRDTLTEIMRRNGHPEVTRHWIQRHRREAHETP